MCLQAYDFTELNKRHGVTLQMGGSDQWGNIVTGIDLGRRMGLEQFYALTTPLITMASGAKMGKTAAGAIWLTRRCSRRTTTGSSGAMPTTPTSAGSWAVHAPAARRNPPARKPARSRDQRGEEDPRQRGDRASAWGGGGRGCSRHGAPDLRGGRAAETLPTVDVPGSEFDAGLGALTAFVRAGLVASTGEARRQIRGGGLRVNDAALGDEKALITREARRAAAWSSCRSAARSTCSCGRCSTARSVLDCLGSG